MLKSRVISYDRHIIIGPLTANNVTQVIKETLDLFTPFKNCKPTLDVEIEFVPVSEAVGEFEVTRSYFPLRHVRTSLIHILTRSTVSYIISQCRPLFKYRLKAIHLIYHLTSESMIDSHFQTGDVNLYQDACCLPSHIHKNITVNGSPFEARSAWDDIAQSIEKATKFIYFTGELNILSH